MYIDENTFLTSSGLVSGDCLAFVRIGYTDFAIGLRNILREIKENQGEILTFSPPWLPLRIINLCPRRPGEEFPK